MLDQNIYLQVVRKNYQCLELLLHLLKQKCRKGELKILRKHFV
jgi:hypothetical protein